MLVYINDKQSPLPCLNEKATDMPSQILAWIILLLLYDIYLL